MSQTNPFYPQQPDPSSGYGAPQGYPAPSPTPPSRPAWVVPVITVVAIVAVAAVLVTWILASKNSGDDSPVAVATTPETATVVVTETAAAPQPATVSPTPVREPAAVPATGSARIAEIRAAVHNTTAANANPDVCGGDPCDRVVIEFSGTTGPADVTRTGGGNGQMVFTVAAPDLDGTQSVPVNNMASPHITDISAVPGAGGRTVTVSLATDGMSTQFTTSTASSPYRVIIDIHR